MVLSLLLLESLALAFLPQLQNAPLLLSCLPLCPVLIRHTCLLSKVYLSFPCSFLSTLDSSLPLMPVLRLGTGSQIPCTQLPHFPPSITAENPPVLQILAELKPTGPFVFLDCELSEASILLLV